MLSKMAQRILIFAITVAALIFTTDLINSNADTTGILSGVVTDQTGAVIAGSEIVVKNISTGLERSTYTNEQGIFRIIGLIPGTYQVTANAAGFRSSQRSPITVWAGRETKVQLVLDVGETSEVVTIEAGEYPVPDYKTQSTTVENLGSAVNGARQSNNKDKQKAKKSEKEESGDFKPTDDRWRVGFPEWDRHGDSSKTQTQSDEPNSGNTEHYTDYGVNKKTDTKFDRFSTFAIDVDTASYTIARRKLSEGALPPAASVRVEEFINYFKYQYPQPATEHPFSLTMEASASPFQAKRQLLRIGLQGRRSDNEQRPAAHLTFLVDTSGSMDSADKLGLVKQSLKLLTQHLEPKDTVAITTYAGGVSIVLPPTSAMQKSVIIDAIDRLRSGGGTAMESGIDLAYRQAATQLHLGGINRIIICSDGDANIGKATPAELLKNIAGYVKEGITVSTIGFGMGNYKDTMMEQFANKGNGNYYYIDDMEQARRIFVEQLSGTIQVIAKDVKIQVEFNPAAVAYYRLIGYENRDIADQDFRNDKVDAGEIGAGHTVTALYEIELKDQPAAELATVRLRYKAPDGEQAQEVSAVYTTTRLHQKFAASSSDFRFAVAAAAFAELLRESPEAKLWSLETIADIARQAAPADNSERQELITLIEKAQRLKGLTASAQ
ncbi:MAG: von Willebrand factor type A domain-containing protein [Acidobacteriota bacterium]